MSGNEIVLESSVLSCMGSVYKYIQCLMPMATSRCMSNADINWFHGRIFIHQTPVCLTRTSTGSMVASLYTKLQYV